MANAAGKITRAEWRSARKRLERQQPAPDREWPAADWLEALRAEGVDEARLGWINEILSPAPIEQLPAVVADAFVAIHGESWRDSRRPR